MGAVRPVAIGFSAAADGRAIFIDRDTTLIAVGGTKGVVVSEDPSSTIANVQSTPANSQLPGVLFNGNAGVLFNFETSGIPLQEGRSIFVSVAAAGTVILYFLDT